MKMNKLFAIPVFAALLALAGCNDVYQPPAGISGGDPGKGYIRIDLGIAGERTLLPSGYSFEKSEFFFTANGSQTEEPEKIDTYVYKLEAGLWDLAIKLYNKATDTNPAATAEIINLTVTAGTLTPYTAELVFSPLSGTGTLAWNISITGAAIYYAGIKLTGLSGQTGKTIDITANMDDSDSAIPAGYYLATVRMEKDRIKDGENGAAKLIVWDEIVHVYPGQATKIERAFTQDNFFNNIKKIWFVGSPVGWEMGYLDNKEMERLDDGTFYFIAYANTGNADSGKHYFRFSLTDTHTWGNKENGAWFLPIGESPVSVAENTVYLMDLLQTSHGYPVNSSWMLPGNGDYEITVNPFTYEFSIVKPNRITGITITAPETDIISVHKGATYQFEAEVSGLNVFNNAITWEVIGASSGTTITTNGFLTVASGETAAEFTVKAKAAGDTAQAATVTVSTQSAQELASVTAPALDSSGVANWTYTDNAKAQKYELQLYKGSTAVGEKVTKIKVAEQTAYTHSFLSVMQEATGTYTFKIQVIGDGIVYTNSIASESGTQTVSKRAAAANLNWNGYTAEWDDGGSLNTNYEVELYRGVSSIGTSTVSTGTSKDFSSVLSGSTENCSYTFKVKALGNNALVLDADQTVMSPAKEAWVKIWLVGDMTSWSDASTKKPGGTIPLGTLMNKEANGTFTWSGYAAANSCFRFSLSDTTQWDDVWNGNWFAPADSEVDGAKHKTVTPAPGENEMERFNTKDNSTSDPSLHATENSWEITAGNYYAITVDPLAKTFTVATTTVTGALVKLYIEDKGENLTITGDTTTKPVIKKTGSPGSVTFTIAGTAPAGTYTWYVDDEAGQTGPSITLDAANYGAGTHRVLLTVTIGTITYSNPASNPALDLGFKVE